MHIKGNLIALCHEGESAESFGPDVLECCNLEPPSIPTHLLCFAKYVSMLKPIYLLVSSYHLGKDTESRLDFFKDIKNVVNLFQAIFTCIFIFVLDEVLFSLATSPWC